MIEAYVAKRRGQTRLTVLDEARYEELMADHVEPLLKRYRHQGFLTIVRGMRLNYEYYLNADPVGAVVICHGMTESAEKYREMTFYFLDAGYSVFALDLRGHGKSYREPKDHTLVHIGKFRDYVNDLHLFVQRIVRPNAVNQPLYLFAHSMGGAVGAMYLSKYPVVFRRAILNAPMIAPCTNGMPLALVRPMAALFSLFGGRKKRVFTFGEFNEEEPFETAASTSLARFDYYRQKRAQYRHLQTNAPTYGWLLQATGVTKTILNKDACAMVQAPVLLLRAATDSYVKPKPQDTFISRIPHGELVEIPESKHEIFLSENRVLQPYLDRILTFFAK